MTQSDSFRCGVEASNVDAITSLIGRLVLVHSSSLDHTERSDLKLQRAGGGRRGAVRMLYLLACQVWGTLQTMELNMSAVMKEKSRR